MDEILTYDEMKKRFDGEFVVVEDPVTDDQHNVLRGKVIAHSKNQNEVRRTKLERRPKRSANLYFGVVPAPGTAIVL